MKYKKGDKVYFNHSDGHPILGWIDDAYESAPYAKNIRYTFYRVGYYHGPYELFDYYFEDHDGELRPTSILSKRHPDCDMGCNAVKATKHVYGCSAYREEK